MVSLPVAANAQDEEAIELPRWFQIEILIFGQNNVNTEEVFRDQPFSLASNSILSDAPAINPLLNKLANGDTKPVETPPLDSALKPLSKAAAALPVLVPEFIPTEKEAYILAEHHEKLRRRRAYRVLWHGSWQQALEENGPVKEYSLSAGRLLLQPLEEIVADVDVEQPSQETDSLDALVQQLSTAEIALDDSAETAIVSEELIEADATPAEQAAKRFERTQALVAKAPKSFRELQGSFKIYKTRFAHIELDLWFTQLDETTPSVSLPLLTIHQPPELDAANNELEALEIDVDEPQTDMIDEATTIANISASDFLEKSDTEVMATIEPKAATPNFELTYELAYEPLLYGHIKEDRRVRPEELYYIDHPLFGAVIKMVEVVHPSLRTSPEEIDPLAF